MHKELIKIVVLAVTWLIYLTNAHRAGSCSFCCNSDDQGASQLNDPERGPVGAPGKAGPEGPTGPAGPKGERGELGENANGAFGSASQPGLSCHDLYIKGIRKDGVYFIKIDQYSSVFQTYCDMTSTVEGWTLVASIHENNILGKCKAGDKWSSEDWTQNFTEGESAWSNLNVFGDIVAVTSADYKNPAYSTLQSANIMVWHVPNNTPLKDLKDEAKYIYKTSNNFLSDNGWTLKELYSENYTLTKFPENGGALDSFLNIMKANSAAVMQQIPDFHEYIYAHSGDIETHIQDGGSDVFDTGNQIQYSVDDGELSSMLVYGETVVDSHGPIITTDKGHPFLFLAWIGEHPITSFKVKVTSNLGADGSGSVVTLSNSNIVLQNGFLLTYKVNEVYSASDPSCAQVFFIIENSNLWETSGNIGYSTPVWESDDTQNLNDEFIVSGSPRNVLVGYTLFTKSDDDKITASEIQNALTALINNLDRADIDSIDLNSGCSNGINSLAVPVNFLQGSPNTLARSVPHENQGDFVTGFVHLRALNKFGLPSAFCPGVKSTGCAPSKMCVGGINTAKYGQRYQCGDFGNWNGNLPLNNLHQSSTTQIARSIDDIQSTILIFYGP